MAIDTFVLRPRIVIVGTGPAGLMAATQLLAAQADITIIDQKPAAGRKFLVAGHGGFNLTHAEPLETFLQKYDSEFIRSCVRMFTPEAARNWLQEIGIDTIVGSSGKVFPLETIKPIDVLNAWLKQLNVPQISWRLKTTFLNFDETFVHVKNTSGLEAIPYDYLVIATGGASWKKTGSDGKWTKAFLEKSIPIEPFEASNSGLEIVHNQWLRECEGQIIKNVRLTAGSTTVPGDVTVTHYGIEGKPVYAVNNWLRNHSMHGLSIDFKPQLSAEQILEILLKHNNVRKSFKELKISNAIYQWLKESLSKVVFTDPSELSKSVKDFQPLIRGFRPVDEVISTVGGVQMTAIDPTGKLLDYENVYCCGEMLDWDAPTGGYLLQACFATGFVVGRTIGRKV